MRILTKVLREDRGASLIEWALLVSLVAVVAILAVTGVGEQNSEMFSEIASSFP
ncbi:MAG: Flp family type IVb pilin [Acidimicrobiia bacterium]|nr:Flp family type IVb pilin [Acidimicrobiia bacterium]MDH5503637.1 Flp family type IVb pilin [Acidimicrobiia bacterium]